MQWRRTNTQLQKAGEKVKMSSPVWIYFQEEDEQLIWDAAVLTRKRGQSTENSSSKVWKHTGWNVSQNWTRMVLKSTDSSQIVEPRVQSKHDEAETGKGTQYRLLTSQTTNPINMFITHDENNWWKVESLPRCMCTDNDSHKLIILCTTG